jgi:hypothetical protein
MSHVSLRVLCTAAFEELCSIQWELVKMTISGQ